MQLKKQSFLGYRINAYFPKYKLAIEVDKQGHNGRDIDYEIKRQKAMENVVANLLQLIQLKRILIFLLKLAKYKITLLNQLKKLTDQLSDKLLRLEFK